MDSLILIVHALATCMMAGIIWFVQWVHYPLYREVGKGEFPSYQARHMSWTGQLVGPVMLVEALTALILVVDPPGDRWAPLSGLILLALIWLVTFTLLVPDHERLKQGTESTVVDHLLSRNWIRTIAWSIRAWLALSLLA